MMDFFVFEVAVNHIASFTFSDSWLSAAQRQFHSKQLSQLPQIVLRQ